MHVAVCLRECVSGVCRGGGGVMCVCVRSCVYVCEYGQVETLTHL